MTDLAAIQAHWNARASLGPTAGTVDRIAAQLEQRAILAACADLPDPAFGLEIGCGTGETARLLVQTYPHLDLLAVDGAAGMIEVARAVPHQPTRLRFLVRDVFAIPDGRFDLIVTQRMLINLPTWALQKQALDVIAARLAPGGRYVMVENSQEGFDFINRQRAFVGLGALPQNWFNRYVRESELASVSSMRLVSCHPFAAAYYYHSRILNALDAQEHGRDPSYDAWINQKASQVSHDAVNSSFSQGRLWLWDRA